MTKTRRHLESIKYGLGVQEIKKTRPDMQAEQERLRLLEIYESLNRHQRLMVAGWLRKGRVENIADGLIKIEARIAQDNAQGGKGVERG